MIGHARGAEGPVIGGEPVKTWLAYLVLAAGGGLLGAVLLVVGVDVVRLSREGPRWRRRMMGAGLLLLAALGLLPMAGGCAAHKAQTTAPLPAELKDDTLGRIHFRLNVLAQELAAERVRPELRWDWYDAKGPGPMPFAAGTRNDQFLVATDLIVTF